MAAAAALIATANAHGKDKRSYAFSATDIVPAWLDSVVEKSQKLPGNHYPSITYGNLLLNDWRRFILSEDRTGEISDFWDISRVHRFSKKEMEVLAKAVYDHPALARRIRITTPHYAHFLGAPMGTEINFHEDAPKMEHVVRMLELLRTHKGAIFLKSNPEVLKPATDSIFFSLLLRDDPECDVQGLGYLPLRERRRLSEIGIDENKRRFDSNAKRIYQNLKKSREGRRVLQILLKGPSQSQEERSVKSHPTGRGTSPSPIRREIRDYGKPGNRTREINRRYS